MKGIVGAVAIGFCILVQPACAIWERSESLEWHINVSDIVAVAEVSSTEAIDLADRTSQEVACTRAVLLKGKHGTSFTFRQIYWRKQQEPPTDDRPLRLHDKLLLFAVEKPVHRDKNVIFWVNLTRPDVTFAQHAAYNNDSEWVGDAESILKVVKESIAAQSKLGNQKRRGLLVDFLVAEEKQEIYWQFVRTADPIYKAGLINQLRESKYQSEKESAIYNLISYPGKETVDFIRPFLKDPTTEQVEHVSVRTDGSGKTTDATITIFPLRQAAYFALKLLGESPKRPEGFYPEPLLPLFSIGFEERGYFPYGDWKRE
jgi:hypothetical protein